MIALVLIRTPLVSEDVVETLREALPDATVLAAESEEALLAQVAALPSAVRVTLAFVEMAPQRLAASALGEELRRRQAQVVLLGSAAEELSDVRCPVLRKPFSDFEVVALVRQLVPNSTR